MLVRICKPSWTDYPILDESLYCELNAKRRQNPGNCRRGGILSATLNPLLMLTWTIRICPKFATYLRIEATQQHGMGIRQHRR